jgi:glucosylceramidase
VRPGARRIASSSGVQGLETVAFRNGDGTIALIVVNTGAADVPFELRAAGGSAAYTLRGGALATLRWGAP